MITAEELSSLNTVDGDVLFMVNKSSDLPSNFISLYTPGHPYIKRSYDFIIHPFSKKYNSMFDLSNKIKNTMVRPSTIVRNHFEEVKVPVDKRYALVYIDADDSKIETILRNIDKSIVEKALLCFNSVDYSKYYDYIKEYNSILPKLTTDGFIKWYKKKIRTLNVQVNREFSNNF